LVSPAPPFLRLLTTLLVGTKLVMNADTIMVTNTSYQDAASGVGYENVAESHGAEEVYGVYGEGMHEGEHAGYDTGFRAGSGQRHHHHHGFFQKFFGDDEG
jgi:hypothetical protein